ncbi:unnamed protein product [Staurois parvus]|uniref:Uncharacterized protein n=1 Tax=Staurois parvus TaxID=386267 RepID=A0ABN9GVN1_9NEOB|nr:unnamed protein product [Staurois parvus]
MAGWRQCRGAVYKWPPRPLLVRAPWERAAHRSSARCVLRTQWNTDRCMRPLCEVPIMCSLIGQSVITYRVVSKMSLLTSLLTTCEICE